MNYLDLINENGARDSGSKEFAPSSRVISNFTVQTSRKRPFFMKLISPSKILRQSLKKSANTIKSSPVFFQVFNGQVPKERLSPSPAY
jgi:hypothetical protein